MNLFVGEIFKESKEFREASINAIKVAAYFRSAQHKYFIGQLRDLQKESYSKYIAIAIGNDTRWNSYLECFCSLLKSKSALRTLGSKFDPSESLNATSSSQNSLYLPAELSSILMNEAWWQILHKLSKLLKPYSIAINLLQRDKAHLHKVLHSFGYFVKFWNEYDDPDLGQRMLTRLESRWKEWEQPLLLLSWLLHPKYRMNKFNSNITNLNHVYLSKWLIYYYEVWSCNKSKSILREYKQFRTQSHPFDKKTIDQFEGEAFSFWTWVAPMSKELGFVAQKIFGICVNAASIERLWSCMGFLHTNRRNRLLVNINN